MKSYLSNNLKFLRLKQNLSQQKLATELGMKRGAYSKYEDKSNEPSILTLFKIKTFYNLNSIDELVFINLKYKKHESKKNKNIKN